MVMVLQQNRKLFKMMKMKVGFQVYALIKSAHFWIAIWKLFLKKSAHVIMDVVDGSPITDELIWRSLPNGRS